MALSPPVTVYLADLTHTGVRLATESFPLNVGLIASYAIKHLGPKVEIQLFKYPERLFEAIERRPPDILGCSNYTWNSHLSEWACQFAKTVSSDTLTVQGGTNYPFEAEGQREFLLSRSATDAFVFYEGEVAFLNLLRRRLDAGSDRGALQAPIDGCQFIDRSTGGLVSGAAVERIKELDDIPSPYLSGLMDEFFDGQLTPMLETTRGCPFACNFCNAGHAYFNRVQKFSVDHVRDELRYIARRVAPLGVTNLTLCDNNFGMLKRDIEIAQVLYEVQQEFGWPQQIMAWTGKNSKERVIAATEILGASLSINMAVQSLNAPTLQLIKRDNISLDAYQGINAALAQQGRSQEAEFIVSLPGETLESCLSGIRSVLESGVKKVTSYTLQTLNGTEYQSSEYRARYGYVTKWRVVPLDFGEYRGRKIFDVEEVAVATSSLSFDDYLEIRSLTFVIELSYNNSLFVELVKLLREQGIPLFDWILEIKRRLASAPPSVTEVYQSFLGETKDELWDSQSALETFYTQPVNYQRLVDGDAGGNVLFKHKGLIISRHIGEWTDFVVGVTRSLIRTNPNRRGDLDEVEAAIASFIRGRLDGVLSEGANTAPILLPSEFDVMAWLEGSELPLTAFRASPPVTYRFFFDELQLAERRDAFSRYGGDVTGLFKIIARTPTLHRLFRRVEMVPAEQPGPQVEHV